jgi:hypothetical protein
MRAIAQPPESPDAAFAGATHAPVELHTFGAAQSSTDWHVVLHVPPVSQLNGAQSFGIPPGSVMMLPEQTPTTTGLQAPLLHAKPLAQSVSTVHVVLHAVVPLHAKPPGHVVAMPVAHLPVPSHALRV